MDGRNDLSVHVERQDLDEMLGNLIENAAKYGGGSVFVTVDPLKEADWCEIWVEDDGMAFDPWAAPEPRREIPALERTPGGQGIMLIKKFAVRCGYERQSEKNCVEVQIARNAEG